MALLGVKHISCHSVRVFASLLSVLLQFDKRSQLLLVPQRCLPPNLHLVVFDPLNLSDFLNFGNDSLEVFLLLIVALSFTFGAGIHHPPVFLLKHCLLHIDVGSVEVVL